MFNWVKQHKISSLILMLVVGVIIGLGIAAKFNLPSRSNAAPAEQAPIKAIAVSGEVEIQDAFINVAEAVGPAVVSIVTESTQKVPGQRFYFGPPKEFAGPNDEQFNKFFKDFFGDIPEREFKQQGLGSGVIIDGEGYIITNDHVISGASKITAILPDGRRFDAELKGTDPRSDLAVIKIKAKDLPMALLGDSDILKTGQWVVAIGNPFGIAVINPKPTVTVGVISALHRQLPLGGVQARNYIDLIQTDAAINPGNSGGPLCDLDGHVIGLNVAIYSTTGGYQGIGFAVPVNTLKNILNDLIEGRKVLYGWLGVTVQELSQEMAEYFKITDRKGVIVVDAIKDGPADKAGIKSGDIIRKFNAKDVDTVQALLKFVGEAKVNQKSQATILRDGKEMNVDIIVGERPAEEALAKGEGTQKAGGDEALTSNKWRGIAVIDITDETAQRYRIEKEEGVLIIEVDEDSPSYEAGLREGLVIKEIDKAAIKTSADFNKIAQSAKGDVLVRTSKGFVIVKEKE